MTTPYDIDDYDIHEGEGFGDLGDEDGDGREQPLPLLAGDALSLALGDEQAKRDDRSFSEVIRRQQDLHVDALWDFLRDHKPDEHEGRVVMQNTASAVIYMLSSQALQVKRRYDELKKQDKELRGEVSKDDVEKAEEYYERWSRGNAMQQYLACFHHRYGWEELERREPPYEEDGDGNPLPVNSGPRYDWHKAAWDMQEADREAILELPPRAYDLFYIWQQMAFITREQNENRAKQLPDLDVSDWLAKLKTGRAKPVEIILGAGWLFQELITFGLAYEGEENPHWKNINKLFRGVTEHARHRRSGWWGRRSMAEGSEE